jgi:citrate lyase subunit beta/citryl-CoA lyase
MTDLALARSLLFVPGTRPDRFAKAAASGADAVVLDLEDAVGPHEKDAARDHVVGWLAQSRGVVRVNAVGTPEHDADLAALRGAPGLDAVMLPKADSADRVGRVAQQTGVSVLPLVETARGVRAADQLAAASGTVRLVIGTLDLAADLGIDDTWEAMLLARSELVLASRAAGIPAPIDGVHVTVADEDGLLDTTRRARALGFGGRLCIHPDQVRGIHSVFAPSDADLDRARRVLAMTDAVGTLDGMLVDEPVRRWARAVLDRAD